MPKPRVGSQLFTGPGKSPLPPINPNAGIGGLGALLRGLGEGVRTRRQREFVGEQAEADRAAREAAREDEQAFRSGERQKDREATVAREALRQFGMQQRATAKLQADRQESMAARAREHMREVNSLDALIADAEARGVEIPPDIVQRRKDLEGTAGALAASLQASAAVGDAADVASIKSASEEDLLTRRTILQDRVKFELLPIMDRATNLKATTPESQRKKRAAVSATLDELRQVRLAETHIEKRLSDLKASKEEADALREQQGERKAVVKSVDSFASILSAKGVEVPESVLSGAKALAENGQTFAQARDAMLLGAMEEGRLTPEQARVLRDLGQTADDAAFEKALASGAPAEDVLSASNRGLAAENSREAREQTNERQRKRLARQSEKDESSELDDIRGRVQDAMMKKSVVGGDKPASTEEAVAKLARTVSVDEAGELLRGGSLSPEEDKILRAYLAHIAKGDG